MSKILGDGTTERYVYDGDHVIMDVTGTHVVKAEYGYEPGVDRLFAIKNTQGSAWTGIAITDPKIGSIWGIANVSGGSIRKVYGLSPWGTGPADTGVITRFRMAGREYDQESKLYYMRARYYDPDLGRFISEDPIGIAGGLNLYAYAGNDPVNGRDPSGMDDCPAQSAPMGSAAGDSGITIDGPTVCGEQPPGPGGPPVLPCLLWGMCGGQPPLPPPGDPNNPMFDPPGNNPQPQPRPVDVGEQAEWRCTGAVLLFELSFAGDATLVFGPLLKAAALGAQATRLEVYAMLRSADGARRVAWGVGRRSVELVGEAKGVAGAAAYDQARVRLAEAGAQGLAGEPFSWWDVLPFIGTKHAASTAAGACNPK